MPRIQISQEAAKALKIAAAMKDMRPHELMESLIMRHCGHASTKPCIHTVIEPDSHTPIEPKLPLDGEKMASRRTAPPEESARKGRAWHGGPTPYEEQHPEIDAEP